jgi:ABC-type transport system substrate-binding protein
MVLRQHWINFDLIWAFALLVVGPRTDRKGGWLDKIIFTAIEEADPAVAQLEAGAIDVMPSAPKTRLC